MIERYFNLWYKWKFDKLTDVIVSDIKLLDKLYLKSYIKPDIDYSYIKRKEKYFDFLQKLLSSNKNLFSMKNKSKIIETIKKTYLFNKDIKDEIKKRSFIMQLQSFSSLSSLFERNIKYRNLFDKEDTVKLYKYILSYIINNNIFLEGDFKKYKTKTIQKVNPSIFQKNYFWKETIIYSLPLELKSLNYNYKDLLNIQKKKEEIISILSK